MITAPEPGRDTDQPIGPAKKSAQLSSHPPSPAPIKPAQMEPRPLRGGAWVGGRGWAGRRASAMGEAERAFQRERDTMRGPPPAGTGVRTGGTERADRVGEGAVRTTAHTSPSASRLVWKSSFLSPTRVYTRVRVRARRNARVYGHTPLDLGPFGHRFGFLLFQCGPGRSPATPERAQSSKRAKRFGD